MTTMSISRNGAGTQVPPGNYAVTLITELRDSAGTGINQKQIVTRVDIPHTLGSLAADLATLLKVPGNVLDLVVTPK
ncbi:hypothetical protein ACGFZP_13155 [Kitasatospora sp. NPDC048239]|uniref:hypothetical protein n=1 Tax=Kitasatospora sp. NPDC048239 TaxID=3364046 RepID=UPI003712A79C